MSYSRGCGVQTAECGATSCRCVSVDADAEIGPEEPAHRIVIGCTKCGGAHAGPCHCDRNDNALQRAHNHSREGA